MLYLPNSIVEYFIVPFFYKKTSLTSPISFIRSTDSSSPLTQYVSDIMVQYESEFQLFVDTSYKMATLTVSYKEIKILESIFTNKSCLKYIARSEKKKWKVLNTIHLEIDKLAKFTNDARVIQSQLGLLPDSIQHPTIRELFQFIKMQLLGVDKDEKIENALDFLNQKQGIQIQDTWKNSQKIQIKQGPMDTMITSITEASNGLLNSCYFHGTNNNQAAAILSYGIMTRAGNSNVDFGQGFYLCERLSDSIFYASSATLVGETATILGYELKDMDLHPVNETEYSTIHHSLFMDRMDCPSWVQPNLNYHQNSLIGPISDESSRFEENLVPQSDMGKQICIKNDLEALNIKLKLIIRWKKDNDS